VEATIVPLNFGAQNNVCQLTSAAACDLYFAFYDPQELGT